MTFWALRDFATRLSFLLPSTRRLSLNPWVVQLVSKNELKRKRLQPVLGPTGGELKARFLDTRRAGGCRDPREGQGGYRRGSLTRA